MRFPRSSGLLLHPTSLPGRYGIGDFGTRRIALSIFLSPVASSSGKCYRLGQRATAIHHMPVTRLSPATRYWLALTVQRGLKIIGDIPIFVAEDSGGRLDKSGSVQAR